ncbi:MAG TPA: polysaccharide deacetylase family protein [Thermoanaerobaculia bacterium]
MSEQLGYGTVRLERPVLVTRVALKIDVDTLRGTAEGIPAMLADLEKAGVRASFFWSVGPDRSGRAIFRVFTKPGFLGKMVRTNAAKMYGFKTALYGTLLPSPNIGRRCRDVMRQVLEAGHEVGLHAWDHVTWQDRLHRLSRPAIDAQLDQGVTAFTDIFDAPPRGFAAPAWYATDDGFEALDARGFAYLSVSRGVAPPFFPSVRGKTLGTLEIPTTLSTLDEDLGRDGITPETYVSRLLERYRKGATEVLTVHAETEGLHYRELFRDLLARHSERGIRTITLGELAAEARAIAPVRTVSLGEIPGRSGKVVLVGAKTA